MSDDKLQTVYLARVMPVDSEDGVYAERVGKTKTVAKNAVKEAASDHIPMIVHNLDWDDDDHVEYQGWIFEVKSYDLHTDVADPVVEALNDTR